MVMDIFILDTFDNGQCRIDGRYMSGSDSKIAAQGFSDAGSPSWGA